MVGAPAAEPTPWVDVCTDEDYDKYEAELCPSVFFVSTLAFDPLYPKSPANVTLIMQPSETLYSTYAVPQKIAIYMPTFEPYAPVNRANALMRDLTITGGNPPVLGQDPAYGYNTFENPLFINPAQWDTQTQTMTLQIRQGTSTSLRADMDTEIRICCLRLPVESARDNPIYKISAPTTQSIAIKSESIMRAPYIDPGYQFEFLQILFNPPQSLTNVVVSLIMRVAVPLGNQNRIILHLPSIDRVKPESGIISFSTAASADPTDWMLFSHEAIWDNNRHTITFFLRAGAVLEAGKQVTLQTTPGEFVLPKSIVSNWDGLQVEARSFDDIDMVIRPTSVTQASRVPSVREFTQSKLTYYNNKPYQKSLVEFTFMTNRPMYAGTSLYLRLAGFQAEVVDVVLLGNSKYHFQNEQARFDLPANLIELKVNRTFYSNEEPFTVQFVDLFLPPATYENDRSLMIKTSDAVAVWQSIEDSPAIGPGTKEFIQSQFLFNPMEPRMPANITFIIKPSINFFQGDRIIFHMYGFLYPGTSVPLVGPKAHVIKDSAAVWDADNTMLTFEVEKNELILNSEVFEVIIPREVGFRLPDKLSQNDGICRIEGRGALIEMEPLKKTPKIGEDKYVIMSRIEFEPVDDDVQTGQLAQRSVGQLSDSVARIWFKLILNTDVLPNSTVYIKLGGLSRFQSDIYPSQGKPGTPQSGDVKLSGANAPLFTGGMGYWDAETNYLKITIVHDVQIFSGERIYFFIERDMYFKLPYAMYRADPSFKIKIPEAGISERPFNFSTRVSQDTKSFQISTMCYGATCSSVVFPDTVTDITLKFRPNVKIPQGSILQIKLPGFSTPMTEIPIGSPEVQVVGESYLADVIGACSWNQMFYTLDCFVPVGQYITRGAVSVMKLSKAQAGFRLPKGALAPNDRRLTLAVIQNQIIYEEPIKSSPRVISRQFIVSTLEYEPPSRDSIFQLAMTLVPTVNITDKNAISITLPKFRRIDSLGDKNVHLMGAGRGLIKDSMARWNQSTYKLTLVPPDGGIIPAFENLELRIKEAQGFILPQSLRENDTRIMIESKGIILPEPVKKSPMVGNGPYRDHLFCMRQYERGVRTYDGRCVVGKACQDPNPPFEDPCSPVQLTKCECQPLTEDPVNITVDGFQLQESDYLSFIPADQLCNASVVGQGRLSSFSPPQRTYISPNASWIRYENISSVDSGYYRICMVHVGQLYDVGKIVVRPSCKAPLVLVDGVCVNDCPKTKVPIAGDCLRDPIAIMPEELQALMLPITIEDDDQRRDLANAPSNDPERMYFKYRFIFDLASLLNCDSNRIIISSLSSHSVIQPSPSGGQPVAVWNGSIIINTIFTPSIEEDGAVTSTQERSPAGLVSLFQRLQSDTSSAMYDAGSLFKDIVRDYKPQPIKVRKCGEGGGAEGDATYRVFCPYIDGTIWSAGKTFAWYFGGQVVVALAIVCLCCGVWRIDADHKEPLDEDILEKLVKDPKLVAPEIRLEFARSWIEGRFMGEKWQKEREKNFLALGH